MTTSLAAQLQKLAVPQTSLLLRDKKRASLLFDPKEAANIDRDTFYDIGISGLRELEKFNTEFAIFENSLFSSTSRQIERAVETAEANTKLNKNIRKFLLLLSPYFLLKPAHKALEWLIHRFSIHDYNKEDILKLILPYHETNIFVKFLQILNVRNENDRWHWLRPLQKSGIHLPKLTLFNHAASNSAFLQFVGEMTLQAIRENGMKANTLTTLFTFYCTCTVGALEQSSDISEPQITAILPPLLKGLSSNIPDFTASAYVIVAQLLKRCRPSHKVLHHITSKLTSGNHTHLRTEATLLLVLMYQLQDTFNVISEKSVSNLIKNDWFPTNLGKLAANGAHVFPFLLPLLKVLLENSHSEDHRKLFETILTEVRFDDSSAEILVRSVLDNCPNASTADKRTREWCSSLLKRLETQYPNPFDKVVNMVMSSKNTQHQQALSSFLNFAMSVCNKENNINVFEKLYHPNPEFRKNAVDFLVKNFPSLSQKEKDIFKSAVKERLLDDNKEVVKAVLNLKRKYLVQLVGKDTIVELLIKLLSHCQSNKWLDVSMTVIPLLCNVKIDCQNRVFLAILPYLLPTNNQELMIALQILKTEYSNGCSVLKTVKGKVPKEITPESFCNSMYVSMSKENCLPNLDVLLEALEEIDENDVLHKYMSVILVTCALPRKSSVETSLKTVKKICSSINSFEMISIGSKNETSPVSNLCLLLAKQGKLPLEGVLLCFQIIIDKTENLYLSNKWLDLPKPSDEITFVIHMFIFLLNGCGSKKYSHIYSTVLKIFFDKFFPNFKNKIEFLSNILIASNFENLQIKLESQLRAGRVLNSLIEKSDNSMNWALDLSSQIFIPSILIAAANPVHEIRTIAVEILGNIINTVSLKIDNTYKPFLQELINRKEEILLDNEQVPLILFSIFEDGKEQYQSVLSTLFNCASDNAVPVHISSMMLKILAFVNSDEIFAETSKLASRILNSIGNAQIIVDLYQSSILYNIILRFNETTAASIKLGSSAWEMLSEAIKQDIVSLEYTKGKFSCPAVLVLEQINRTVFANLEFDVQYSLIKLLAEVATEAENPEVVTAVGHVVKRIDLDARLVVEGLSAMRDVKSKKMENNQRKVRKGTLIPTADILETKEWERGVAMLEFIQDKKKLMNAGVILPVLFGVLKRCLDFDEQAPLEYPKQLLLSSILHCCLKMENENEAISESTFNMELVVQCVRASQNPQTHHHALLVLAHTAALIPEQVLHNIMAIFTFMGSSVLRHDDAYSFQIISKIIETVIPILVQVKDTEDKNEIEQKVGNVLRVFVYVILDVPEHRRMPLYTKLLTTLGVEEYLWLFLLLIFEAHVVHGNEKQKKVKSHLLSENVPQRLNVATDITLEYSPAIVINTCIKLFEYLKQLPEEKDNARDADTVVFNIKKYTPKQFRHYKYNLVTFLAGLLQAKPFVNRVALMSTKETLEMESLYKNMIINILTYIQSISKTADRSVGTPQAQYWKVMLHHSYDILDSVNALLTTEMFLLVIRGLVVHNIQTVRRKALELLNTKLQHQPSFFYTNSSDEEITETENLFALLPSLIDIIKTINTENVDPEQELLQQTSLLTLKLLIKLLADKNQDKFIPLLDFITDLIKSNKAQGNILASVVLCLAELVNNLRAHAIPGLVKFMPAIIKVLKLQKHQETPNLLLMCTITAVQKIVESLPLFLSPYLEKLLCEISILSSKWEDDENNQKIAPFVLKLKGIRSNIGNSIPSRVLIPIIGETYNTLLKHRHYNSVNALMNVLSENLSSVRGQELNALLPELTSFFLTALQFRTDSSETVELTQINVVEDHVIKALTVLVLKLSETTFRPFYYKLYDWAVRSDTRNERIITFYRLSSAIAESLKALFVLFAGHFVKNAASVMDECNTYKSEKLYFDDETKCILLVESVLNTLKTVFTYDGQSFVDKDRFEALMQPLVDQLENKLGGIASLSARANELIIPCIAQFALSAADDTLWKQLNYQVLLKTRHDLPSVRLIGLNCISAIAHKIGEDFLPLLPETIPFLAELLEDEDESVETSCQKVVQDLEKVLGEPLQKYF